jgi:hypothetical protein
MSNRHLPSEILDHVIDHLHNAEDALRNCCLVSKSWVPRARKHLFADIAFPTERSSESWKEMFPDPSTSPACYAKTLSVICPLVATSGSWIGGFSRVEHLVTATHLPYFKESATPLLPLHGFSPVIKSLHVAVIALPPSQILNLILSFPLLEDLAVIVHHGMLGGGGDDDGSEEDDIMTTAQPPIPPTFAGSLELSLNQGVKPITRRLLSLPGGIHFRKLILTCFSGEDIVLITALVEGCSHTLESLDISDACRTSARHLRPHLNSLLFAVHSSPASFDLSKATKLKDVVFGPYCGGSNGLLQHSKPSHPSIGTFGGSRFIYLTTVPSLCSLPTMNPLWE